jgi:hypothetical protein
VPHTPDRVGAGVFDGTWFSSEANIIWDAMVADSYSHLTQAQDILEELAKGMIGPDSATLSCVEACHSVATALVILAEAAASDATQESGPMRRPGW